jgi:hypothetical protein
MTSIPPSHADAAGTRAARSVCAILAAVLCAALGGLLAEPGVPVDARSLRAQTTPPGGAVQVSAQAVAREPIDLPGAPEPHTPPALNRALAFRYYLPGAPPPSTVLVLNSGIGSGVNTLDLLARALVAAPGREVWVVTRRSALLQDNRGIAAAVAYGNPDFALGYYYGNLEINGHTFRHLTSADVAFAAYWGLDVHLRDIRAIVREARHRYPLAHIVLGGHSFGGILAALYAGYDFGRVPGALAATDVAEDIGARDLSGLLLLDGLPINIRLLTAPNRYLHGFWLPTIGRIPGVNDLTSADPRRQVWPFLQTHRLHRTEQSILFDVLCAYAFLRPGERSYFPFYPRRGLAITNDALIAAVLSDQMQPDLLIRTTIPPPLGIFERVLDPAGLNPRGLLDLQSGQPALGERVIRVAPEDPQRPPRVNLRTLLGAILRPGADFTQWYLPWRLVLDVGLAADLQPSTPFAQQFMGLTHMRDTALPILIVGAGHGLIRSPDMTRFYESNISTPPAHISVAILDDYTHFDLEVATPNPTIPLILSWLTREISPGGP